MVLEIGILLLEKRPSEITFILLFFINSLGLHVWDFKTGLIDEFDLQAYHLQLKWYAFAIAQKTRPRYRWISWNSSSN